MICSRSGKLSDAQVCWEIFHWILTLMFIGAVQVEGEAMHLPLLLRCIEQGGNLFSDLEKDLLCRQEEAPART